LKGGTRNSHIFDETRLDVVIGHVSGKGERGLFRDNPTVILKSLHFYLILYQMQFKIPPFLSYFIPNSINNFIFYDFIHNAI
jgi:hypothetical protein